MAKLNKHGDPLCPTCNRSLGYRYESPNDCCTVGLVEESVEEVVEEAHAEVPKEEKTVEKPKKKTTPKKKAPKKA